jgi:hypothetical protein
MPPGNRQGSEILEPLCDCGLVRDGASELQGFRQLRGWRTKVSQSLRGLARVRSAIWCVGSVGGRGRPPNGDHVSRWRSVRRPSVAYGNDCCILGPFRTGLSKNQSSGLMQESLP